MARILAYTSPAIGHLFPMTPLLLELQRRGHEVHLRTLAQHVDLMRSLGLSAEAMDPRIPEIVPVDFTAKSPVEGLKLTVRTFGQRARLDGPDLQRALAAVRPDLVIVDINSWGAQCAAEAWGGPWLTFSPYTPPLSSKGTPPFGPGFDPIAGPVGRVRDAVMRPLVMGAAERVFRPMLNPLRAEYGLPPVRGADDFFRGAPLLVVTTSEPLEYPHPDWDDGVRLVGALSWDPPAEAPAWLAEIEGPIVLLTTSSEYQADEALIRAAIEGLGGEPYTVVATMPAGLQSFTGLPPNIRVVEFVPHGSVLDRAVVAVTHGGLGATQKALSRGVPVCVVPFGRDQLEVAARVVHADAGTRLKAKHLTPDGLRAAVLEAQTKRPGAERVAAGFRAAGGAAAAADATEALLREPAPRA